MPEGHTLHRLAREHRRAFGGTAVRASSPQGRFADGAAIIDGQQLVATDAYGKHLFHRYGNGALLHVHLGLYGTFTGGVGEPPAPRGALRLRLANDREWTDLRGPTACELITPGEVEILLARLGPDPLRRRADPERAWQKLQRSRMPVAALLMDQEVIAGVGNVYRAELLFRHRLDPTHPGRAVRRDTWDAMWTDLVALMRAGVRTGRIVTVRPEHRPAGRRPLTREEAVYVYRRAGLPCRVCGTAVRTAVLAGRNLFWCPACQAPH